jgi:hypothetical protein
MIFRVRRLSNTLRTHSDPVHVISSGAVAEHAGDGRTVFFVTKGE